MAVMKKKNIDWQYYLRELALSSVKISDVEKIEFAGYLFLRDLDRYNYDEIIMSIINLSDYSVPVAMAKLMIAESPESTHDLITTIKDSIYNYYENEIAALIANEEIIVEEEKKLAKSKENPKDEYDPNLE